MIPAWLQEHCDRLTDDTDRTLAHLNLNIRRLNLEELRALCAALRRNHLLTTLNLTTSVVNNTAATKLLSMNELGGVLRHHPTLHVLHLSYNQLQNVQALGEALSAPTCILGELHLDYNRLDDSTITYLARGLSTNTRLKVLQLHHNRLTDDGAVALANMLQHNTTLETLDLHRNNIGKAGGRELLQVSQKDNVTIQHLCMDQNAAIPTSILAQMAFYTKLNRCGRRHWSTVCRGSVWPRILHKYAMHPDVVFWILQQRQLPVVSSDLQTKDTGDAMLTDNR